MKKKMSDCSEYYPDDCSKCPEKQESAPQKDRALFIGKESDFKKFIDKEIEVAKLIARKQAREEVKRKLYNDLKRFERPLVFIPSDREESIDIPLHSWNKLMKRLRGEKTK